MPAFNLHPVLESDMVLHEMVKGFSNHMLSKFGATLVPKEDSLEMKAIAIGMDLGNFIGMGGLASSESFMTRYTTTLGTNIYMPKAHREDLLLFLEILTHECQHVIQFKESGVEFAWLYLSEPEARVKYEADAYAAGMAVTQWLTGSVPLEMAEWVVKSLVEGYHLRREDAELAADLIKSHMVSLTNGMVMSRSAREAISYLEANYGDLKGAFQ